MLFWRRVKYCISTALALLVAGVASLFVFAATATKFPNVEGARTFYLDSASSQATIKSELSLFDVFRVRGESVSLALTNEQALALVTELGGEILFTEQAAGVRSYYCYAPALSRGIRLGKYYVNLQVAVGGNRCVVGTPIIFGGF